MEKKYYWIISAGIIVILLLGFWYGTNLGEAYRGIIVKKSGSISLIEKSAEALSKTKLEDSGTFSSTICSQIYEMDVLDNREKVLSLCQEDYLTIFNGCRENKTKIGFLVIPIWFGGGCFEQNEGTVQSYIIAGESYSVNVTEINHGPNYAEVVINGQQYSNLNNDIITTISENVKFKIQTFGAIDSGDGEYQEFVQYCIGGIQDLTLARNQSVNLIYSVGQVNIKLLDHDCETAVPPQFYVQLCSPSGCIPPLVDPHGG